METAGPSGSIEIKGATWHWRLLDPRAEPPSGDEGEDAAFISFHSADDPSREMRCVVSEGVDREFSDEEVRDLFDQAWAVKS